MTDKHICNFLINQGKAAYECYQQEKIYYPNRPLDLFPARNRPANIAQMVPWMYFHDETYWEMWHEARKRGLI